MKGGIMLNKYLNHLWILAIIYLFAGLLFAEEKDMALKIGDKAPEFVLNNQDGELWSLKNHLGKKNIVVYFYPAAMTGGCTKQACSYRDAKSDMEGQDIIVVGISGDAVKNLKAFQQAHQLNFNLLSDASGEIAKKFGVPLDEGGSFTTKIGEDEISLERSYTSNRWTFMIDKQGKIAYKDTEVDAAEDGNTILEFFKK
jgi:peroxiredoxin Q/BCP